MPGMLAERRRIVNRSGLLRTDRSQFGTELAAVGRARDLIVDQTGELAAGIVVGLTSVTIKPRACGWRGTPPDRRGALGQG
jgi:hypothetical protein